MSGEYIKGILELKIEGINLERFINRCNAQGIVMYNIYRESYDCMYCAVLLRDFRRIAIINRELRCRIRIKRRYGIRFLMNRIARRKAFVIGAAMFIIFMMILSSSIWRIEVMGIDKVTATEIINIVNKANAGIGIFKTRCDTKSLELEILKNLDDVEWVIVDISGVVMRIQVIETVDGIERVDTRPSSIISEVNGEIVYVSTLRGDQLVKVGDKITAGQTLINGIYDRRQEENFYMIRNAMGEIRARVEYKGAATLDVASIDRKIYTGNEKTTYSLNIAGWVIGGADAPDYDNYDTEIKTHKVLQNGKFFPIYTEKITYKEYRLMTEEELSQKIEEELFKKSYNDANRRIPIGAVIEESNIMYNYDAEKEVYFAETAITAVHSIGVKKILSQSELDEFINSQTKGEDS